MNISDGAAMAIMVVAMASCTAASYFQPAEPQRDATTECVKRAWTQADRIECVKASPK